MRCPDCGLHNASDRDFCSRCGAELSRDRADAPSGDQPGAVAPPRWGPRRNRSAEQPAAEAAPASSGEPGRPSPWRPVQAAQEAVARREPEPPKEPTPKGPVILKWGAVALLVLAGLACAGYTAWIFTARRRIFADLATDPGSVSVAAAQRSDQTDTQLLWTAIGLLIAAVVVWVVARFRTHRPFGTVGFTAFALMVVGGLLVAGGAYVTSRVGGQVANAGDAATGVMVIGGGFGLAAAGALVGVLAVLSRPR